MVLRVTFDSNILDKVCRPERFPKDPDQPLMQKVHDALQRKEIEGFYSVGMLTIEGIERKDRADVFSRTRTVMKPETHSVTKNNDLPQAIQEIVGDADVETVSVELQVEQPNRKALPREVVARLKAAKELGVKVLKGVPRIGAVNITDPTGEYYLSTGKDDELSRWIEKAHEVSRAIESQGVGFSQIKKIGQNISIDDPKGVWFESLDLAADIHEQRAVERAFSEWADGDAIASHIAYGIDIFCTADIGNSNASASILDSTNREWLSCTYDVQFMNLKELASKIP